ncbi:MAG: hypothetical protein ABJ382_22270, partial [Ilumatobacter sp.]
MSAVSRCKDLLRPVVRRVRARRSARPHDTAPRPDPPRQEPDENPSDVVDDRITSATSPVPAWPVEATLGDGVNVVGYLG